MSVTLDTLMTRCRQRADMVNSNFIKDPELTGLINTSIQELHDLLIQSYDNDYYISSYSFSTSASVDSYALPSDFYKMKGLDLKINSGYWHTIKPFNFADRNTYQAFNWAHGDTIKYRIRGSNLVLMPVPDSSIEAQLWYIPSATELTTSGSTFDGINGYEEYVVIDTAIKMRIKEESDITELAYAKKEMKKRIEEAAQNRDAGFPMTITDSQSIDTFEYWNDG